MPSQQHEGYRARPWHSSWGGPVGARDLSPGREESASQLPPTSTRIGHWGPASLPLGPREVDVPPSRKGLEELPIWVGGLLSFQCITQALGKIWILNWGDEGGVLGDARAADSHHHTLGIYR